MPDAPRRLDRAGPVNPDTDTRISFSISPKALNRGFPIAETKGLCVYVLGSCWE